MTDLRVSHAFLAAFTYVCDQSDTPAAERKQIRQDVRDNPALWIPQLTYTASGDVTERIQISTQLEQYWAEYDAIKTPIGD